MAGAQEVRQFQVTCTPPTPKSAPLIVDLDMPDRTVLGIRVRVPPGPNGVMGFAIGSTGTNVIPLVDGTWIVASDEIIVWNLAGQIDSGSWQAIMYNTGQFDHTIYITFTVELPDLPGSTGTAQPIDTGAIVALAPADTVDLDTSLPPPPELT